MCGFRFRRHSPVRDDIVEEIRRARSWKAQKCRLDGRRTVSADGQPVALGPAVQIDQDIGTFGLDVPGGSRMTEFPNIDEGIATGCDLPAVVAFVVGTVRIEVHTESVAVMSPEQTSRQMSDRVIPRVPRQVGEVQSPVAGGRTNGMIEQRWIPLLQMLCPTARYLKVQGGVLAGDQAGERRFRNSAVAVGAQGRFIDCRVEPCEGLPVADFQVVVA